MNKTTTMSVVWITGASSGIGEVLARKFSEKGDDVILSARRENELERVKASCANPNKCIVVALDLNDEPSLQNAVNKVFSIYDRVDILINNGGISQRSLIGETPIEIDRKIMQIDYFSGVFLTKSVLGKMLENKCGHIVAISSIVGVFGFPQRSAYSAAKHAMHGFYETLRAECEHQGIKVLVVCPGRILTNISLHALTKDDKAYGIMDHAQKNGITAEKCATKIMRAISRNKKEIFICRKDILMVYFRRYIPFLYYKLVSKVKPN